MKCPVYASHILDIFFNGCLVGALLVLLSHEAKEGLFKKGSCLPTVSSAATTVVQLTVLALKFPWVCQLQFVSSFDVSQLERGGGGRKKRREGAGKKR